MATKKKSTALAVKDASALAAIDFGEHKGAGQENMSAADQKIPFLSILQALSKVISDPTKKVEGATPGMIMDSVSKELFDGEKDGIIFLPCSSSGQVYVEWQGEPGSGTPVNRFQPNDPIVVESKRKYAFNEMKVANGNRLMETFYVVGLRLDDDMNVVGGGIISFSSTKINSYKESIGEIFKIPGGAPLYAFPLRLKTKPETRAKGTSFNFTIMPNGYDGQVFKDGIAQSVILPDSEQAKTLYPLGKKLADDFLSGSANIDTTGEGAHGGDGGGGSEDEPY